MDISMDAEIKNAISATGTDAQYDEKAKRLLGNKIILAHILVKTVDEFKGMNPKDVRFDIIFYVRMKDGISKVIVNLEAQKDEPAGYHILNRAVFYVSRLVSSQKERDFVNGIIR